jgi:hypothetical protein
MRSEMYAPINKLFQVFREGTPLFANRIRFRLEILVGLLSFIFAFAPAISFTLSSDDFCFLFHLGSNLT